MAGLVILFWGAGFLMGWGLSYKLTNRVLKHQVRYLKGRVQLLRTIWIALEKPVPKGRV